MQPATEALPAARPTSQRPGLPLVAIVGRPNVGKSSLFNALAGRREAIVSEIAGTTRDRLYREVDVGRRKLLLVDTGGIVVQPETALEANVSAQVDEAVAEADVIVFVTDTEQGVTPHDAEVAERLRRAGKRVVLVANKADNPRKAALAVDMYALGLGDPLPVSSLHRHGLDDLLDAVLAHLPPAAERATSAPAMPHLALVGRPNVGKSMLANAILGTERSIVAPEPGTTRDAIDSLFTFDDRHVVLIDTAGMRRRGHVDPGIESYSVLRAARAITRSDVAILVLDATELVTAQDLHVAGQVLASFKGMVVAVNKWDLVPPEEADAVAVRALVLKRLKFAEDVPVVFTSALQREGVRPLLATAFVVYDRATQRVPADRLTEVVMGAVARHLPPSSGPRALKVFGVRQEGIQPPTFVLSCNNPALVHFSYERYLTNVIRSTFNFAGVPLRLEFRGHGKVRIANQERSALPEKQRLPRRQPQGQPGQRPPA